MLVLDAEDCPIAGGRSAIAGRTLYAAETFSARIWAWDVTAPGQLAHAPRNMLGGTGRVVTGLGGLQLCDSMAVDAAGNLHVATIPHGISVISPDGRLLAQWRCRSRSRPTSASAGRACAPPS